MNAAFSSPIAALANANANANANAIGLRCLERGLSAFNTQALAVWCLVGCILRIAVRKTA